VSSSDLDREQLLRIFSEQTDEGLSAMEQTLISLEADPANRESLHSIFRVCHTLKGDAASLGFEDLAEFAHVLEGLLARLREGVTHPSRQLVSLLLRTVDALRELAEDAIQGQRGKQQHHEILLQQLQQSSTSEPVDPHPFGSSSPVDPSRDDPSETLEASLLGRSRSGSPTLRVRVDTLDRLLNLIGEIAIARSHLEQMLEAGDHSEAGDLLEAHRDIDPLFAELQHEVMKVRMVPAGPMFRQHLRTVRELALAHGKSAGLAIEGEDAELDTTVIEHLRDPLTHLIRNAIAHGIEPPEERAARKKDPHGRITLRAFNDGASIVVQVADDGAGFDRRRIRERAGLLGLVAEPEKLTDAQLDRIVFEPGFSTAESATVSSGRGVGMDVVRRNIEALGGSASIDSVEGRGTTVAIRLPLTLSIIEGFAVGVDGEVYVIPLNAVIECLDLPRDQERGPRSSDLINLRGSLLPYVGLREILGTRRGPSGRETLVVVRDGSQQAGIAVDVVYGERQAVVKPLGKPLRGVPGIAGSTILGNGRVALILDIPTLLRTTVGWQGGGGNRRLPQVGTSASGATSTPQTV
jgi:two-component system chemotaxis sensor kinase CheA